VPFSLGFLCVTYLNYFQQLFLYIVRTDRDLMDEGSSTISARSNSSKILDLFGQIPAGQDVGVGTYTDSITTTVIF
jgi:spore coat protein U-like protein